MIKIVINYFCILTITMLSSVVVFAQECNSNMVVDTPNERFEVRNDGTVLDRNTQLIWKKCAEGQEYNSQNGNCEGSARLFVSNEALGFTQYINTEGFAGHNDWRIPNIKELSSIVESSCVNPAINLVVFKNTPSSGYFRSSTPSVPEFYCVNFGNGNVSDNCDLSGDAGAGMGSMGGPVGVYEGYVRFVRN